MENKLNHFDQKGNAVMVDVSDKPVTHRTATATGSIQVSPEIMAAVKSGNVKKRNAKGRNVKKRTRKNDRRRGQGQ